MSKSVLSLLFLTLSGLQAAPIAPLRGLPKASSPFGLSDGSQQNDIIGHVPDSFQQGTEPSKGFFDNGLVQDHINGMTALTNNLLEEGLAKAEAKHWLADEVPMDVPAQRNGGGWVRVEEPSPSRLPDGFRQGTEPFMSIPDGFRQGTEPFMSIPDGFKQGTEPSISIPDGFKQGTEPSMFIPDGFRQGSEPFLTIPDGFRQGTEPSMSVPDGFRQGTEPFMSIPDSFRQGTEPFMPIPDSFRQGTEPFMPIPDGFRQGTQPFMSIPDGFRQGTEPFISIPPGFRQGTEPTGSISRGLREEADRSISRLHKQSCNGEVIDEKCYEFNPTPLAFKESQDFCKARNPDAELASVTSADLHSCLVSMVTNGGERSPQLTWLGATVKNQQASWLDGSQMDYSDWMPGQPNIHTDKTVCVEMFKIDESWWTAADCDLRRASICSYRIAA